LKEEGREIIYKGLLKRRGGLQSDSGELLVFLLDHALLMVKQKNKADQLKVYRRVHEGPGFLRKYADELFIADSARTTARHRSRRNRHAFHRLAPLTQQL
jgi:hypothetical protein